jgi:tetratricopeptide (TPR) repeat protein
MSQTTKQYPKFSWDHDVPNTPFWKDLPFTTARNFLKCFSDEELEAMSFPDDMAKDDKWRLLLSRLQQKEAAMIAKRAPAPLYDANQDMWMNLVLGRYTMHMELKEYDAAEAALQEMSDHGTYNNQMAAKNMLADLYATYGRYAEAEAMGRECLTWLREMAILGPQSPQALGCERRLMAAIWKQGRYEEARTMQDELRGLVEGLPGTKFDKYVDDERRMLAELIAKLEGWREEHDVAA